MLKKLDEATINALKNGCDYEIFLNVSDDFATKLTKSGEFRALDLNTMKEATTDFDREVEISVLNYIEKLITENYLVPDKNGPDFYINIKDSDISVCLEIVEISHEIDIVNGSVERLLFNFREAI